MSAGRTVRGEATLEISTRIRPAGDVVVAVAGELDVATAGRLIEIISAVIDQHGPRITIDLAKVPFCDASGLRALLNVDEFARARNGRVRVIHPPSSLARILRISGPDQRLVP